jgi:hypothetical protein
VSGLSTTLFPYNARTNIQSGNPGNTNIIWNNATQASATQINVSHLDRNNEDIDVLLGIIQSGTRVIIQDANDSTAYQTWIFGAGTEAAPNTYWTFPVTYVDGGHSFTGGENILLIIAQQPSGTSGSSGSSGTSGEDGTSGQSGTSGSSGTSGESGTSGTDGTSGQSGTSGSSGTSGESGTSGTDGTSGQSGTSGSSGTSGTSQAGLNFTAVFSGGGAVIAPGVITYIRAPRTCTITKVTLLADQTGSAVLDIYKDSYANFPPTAADSICASAKPTLSSAIKYEDSTLTGWTTSITAGQVLGFTLDSCSTITQITLQLETA